MRDRKEWRTWSLFKRGTNGAFYYKVSAICYIDAKMSYKPGDGVPITGVYRVIHDSAHTTQQPERVIENVGRFPKCKHCGDRVRFELVKAVLWIRKDQDFK
jgi:hypothetical protein